MAKIRKSLETAIELACGCVWLGFEAAAAVATKAPIEPGIFTAIAATKLIALAADGLFGVAPDSAKALQSIRKRTLKAVEREVAAPVDGFNLDLADAELEEVLQECVLNGDRLVEAASHGGDFAEAATTLILDELATRRPATFGEAAPGIGRRFARSTIFNAVSLTVNTPAYFEKLRPKLDLKTFELLRQSLVSTVRIEGKVDELRAGVADGRGAISRVESDVRGIKTAMEAAVVARAAWKSPYLVVKPRLGEAPRGLKSFYPLIDRDDDVTQLRGCCEPNGLILVRGPILSGKTAVIQKFVASITDEEGMEVMGRPISLLHVDLSTGRPLRAFDEALRAPADFSPPDMDRSDPSYDEEDDGSPQFHAWSLLRDRLSGQVDGTVLILVLSNYSGVVQSGTRIQEIQSILESDFFGQVFTIVETDGEGPMVLRRQQLPDLGVGPMGAAEAIELLISRGQEHQTSADAVGYFNDDPGFLFPGVLVNGAAAYPPILRSRGRTPTGDDLALAFLEEAAQVARTVVEALCDPLKVDATVPLKVLAAMAVLAEASVESEALAAAGLPISLVEELQRLDWMADGEASRLHGFGRHALRALAREILESGGPARSGVVDTVFQLIGRGRASDEFDAEIVAAREEAANWLRRWVPNEGELRRALDVELLQRTALDEVSPLTDDEESDLAPILDVAADQGDFDAALGALVLLGRARELTRTASIEAAETFLRTARRAAELASAAPNILSWQLRALDFSLYRGGRHHHRFRELLAIRLDAHQGLERQAAKSLESGDQWWILWWISWLLNEADLHVGLGNVPAARELLQKILSMLAGEVEASQESMAAWLRFRAMLLEERLTTDPAARIEVLRSAVERAGRSLERSAGEPRWLELFLRANRRLVRQLNDDPERKAAVDAAFARIRQVEGPPSGWPRSTRAQVAALMRDEAQRAWNSKYQIQRVQEALTLIQAGGGGASEAQIAGDPRDTLVEARLLAFLGRTSEAEKLCDLVVRLSPSGAAWHLKLKLVNDRGGRVDPSSVEIESDARTYGELPAPMQNWIRQFRDWVTESGATDRATGRTILWAIRREWKAQGSIERFVARRARDQENRELKSLPWQERNQRFATVHNQRQQRLLGIRKRFGDFVDLTIAEFWNEAQFQRSMAVWNRTEPRTDIALKVLNDALRRWPDSHILTMQIAEYNRYIWNLEGAMKGLRVVMASAPNGDLRREASLTLARTLHMAASNDLQTRGRGLEDNRETYLLEAKAIVGDLLGRADTAAQTAILRDHIALELGEEVDWAGVDDVFDLLVRDVDGYPNALLENLDEILSGDTAAPEQLHELMRQEVAHPETLGLAGMLYLRRAELLRSNRPVDDARHALALFNAIALLERSWEGGELPLTSFRRARAIMTAARLSQNLNPFDHVSNDGKEDQLAVAQACLANVVSRTTGQFRALAQQYVRQARLLRQEIEMASSVSVAEIIA